MVIYIVDFETEKWSLENHLNQKKDIITLKTKFGCIEKANDFGQYIEGKVVHTPKELIDYFIDEYNNQKTTHSSRKSNKPSLQIFIHNLDFDFTILYSYLMKNNAQMHQIKLNATLGISVKIKSKLALHFRNSCPLFYWASVKDIGKMIGLEKLEQDYDSEETEEFRKYCFRDCEIVALGLEFLRKFFNKQHGYEKYEGIRDLPLTSPSLCFKLFKEKNADVNWFAPNLNDKFYRLYFFGGRTEVFNCNLVKRVICFDYNSTYVDVMVHYKYPLPPYAERLGNDIPFTENTCLYFCEIKENAEIPLIPLKDKNGKVLFTNCRHKALLQPEELEYLQKHNVEIKHIYHVDCEGWLCPFEYLTDTYAERVKAKKEKNPEAFMLKLPLLATYGRNGMKPERVESQYWTEEKIEECYGSLEEFTKAFEKCGGGIQPNTDGTFTSHKKVHTFCKDLNIITAIRVCSLARLKLTNDICKLKANGIEVYYCDTDSLWIDAEQSDLAIKLLDIDEFKLGALKIEHCGMNFQALSPKEYFFDESIEKTKEVIHYVKCKGIKVSNLTEYYLYGYKTVRPMKLPEMIKKGVETLSSILVEKNKESYYDKRIINKDLTTTPIDNLNEMDMIIAVNENNIKQILQTSIG